MSERDLEDRLRPWLASRAPRDVPPSLVARAQQIPREAEPPLGRAWPPIHLAVAASAVVVAVVVTLAGMNLLGLVPAPRSGSDARCGPENLERAIAALERVPGYRYAATGHVETRDPRVPGPGVTLPPADRHTVSFEADYIAPDRVHVRYGEGRGDYLGIEEIVAIGDSSWFLAPRDPGDGPGSAWRAAGGGAFSDARPNPIRHMISDGLADVTAEDWVPVDGSGVPGDGRPSCTLQLTLPRPDDAMAAEADRSASWTVRIDLATDLPIAVRQEIVPREPVVSGDSVTGVNGFLMIYEVTYEVPGGLIEPPPSAIPAP